MVSKAGNKDRWKEKEQTKAGEKGGAYEDIEKEEEEEEEGEENEKEE